MSSTVTGMKIGVAASLDVNAAGGALVAFVLSRIVGRPHVRHRVNFSSTSCVVLVGGLR